MNPQAFNSFVSRKPMRTAAALAALTALTLSACGGGGGGGGGGPEPTVSAMNINPVQLNLQSLMVTIEGTNLAQGLTVASPQCTSLTRSTAAPNASDATTAYYQCATTAASSTAVTVTATRSSDGGALKSATFTVGAAPTVVEALAGTGGLPASATDTGTAGTAKYGQMMTIEVRGTNVNQGLAVSSSSCGSTTLSNTPPNVSTASTAYYRCRANAASALTQAVITPLADPTAILLSPLFTIPVPQVTLSIKRGAGSSSVVLGNVVMTLAANEAPITVNNFLDYVNTGFYNGTIFDLIVKTPTPTLLAGGTYGPTSGTPKPTTKAANAPIPLEVGQGLSNVQWSVGMDRLPSGVDTATTGFYINMVDNLQLNPVAGVGGFAVFGAIDAGSIAVLNLMAISTCDAVTGFSDCLPGPNLIIDAAVQTR